MDMQSRFGDRPCPCRQPAVRCQALVGGADPHRLHSLVARSSCIAWFAILSAIFLCKHANFNEAKGYALGRSLLQPHEYGLTGSDLMSFRISDLGSR